MGHSIGSSTFIALSNLEVPYNKIEHIVLGFGNFDVSQQKIQKHPLKPPSDSHSY